MNPHYMNTHLTLLGTSSPSFFRYLGIFRCFGMNKKVCSYHFLVSFFQIGELSLSLGVLGPFYTLKIMLSPTLSFLGKGHCGLRGLICFAHHALLCHVPYKV